MLKFLRENFKMLLWVTLFFAVVAGGIYYVEKSLEAQVQVVD